MPRTKAKTWSFVTFGLAAPLEIGTSESLLHAETCVWVGVGVGFTDVRLRTVSKIGASRTPYAFTLSILHSVDSLYTWHG